MLPHFNHETTLAALLEQSEQLILDCEDHLIDTASTVDRCAGVYAIYHEGELAYVGQGIRLRDRLTKHKRTVNDAERIDSESVTFKAVACNEAWRLALEHHMIAKYNPPWNTMGFGSNAHGSGRPNQRQSAWNVTYGRQTTR